MCIALLKFSDPSISALCLRLQSALHIVAMPRRYKILFWVGGLSILADQLTKYWARGAFGDGSRQVIVDGFWHHVLAWNEGSAFSMFEGRRWMLTIVAAAAIGLIGYMVHKAEDKQTKLVWALSLMLGGAIGNLIDRIYFGKVTDFILWYYKDFKWPVFNIADVVLVVAVGLYLIVGIEDMKAEKAKKAEEAKAS